MSLITPQLPIGWCFSSGRKKTPTPAGTCANNLPAGVFIYRDRRKLKEYLHYRAPEVTSRTAEQAFVYKFPP